MKIYVISLHVEWTTVDRLESHGHYCAGLSPPHSSPSPSTMRLNTFRAYWLKFKKASRKKTVSVQHSSGIRIRLKTRTPVAINQRESKKTIWSWEASESFGRQLVMITGYARSCRREASEILWKQHAMGTGDLDAHQPWNAQQGHVDRSQPETTWSH